MKIDTLVRHLREAYRGLRRNTWMSFAAVSAVSVTLLIFGVFLVLAFNISYMAKEVDKTVGIMVELNSDLTADQKEEVLNQIKGNKMTADATLIPKEDALREFKELLGDSGNDILAGLDSEDENPLPDTIKVIPNDIDQFEALTEDLKKYPEEQVLGVDNGGNLAKSVLDYSGLVQNIMLGFGLVLAIMAAFLISNTIKLTIIARKREIEIQRLVGASNWFIRWPFFIEGATMGMLGSISPILITIVLYWSGYNMLNPANEPITIMKLMPVTELSLYVSGTILLMGVLIGIWGSIISVRRFLKI
ncbi:ABC transporter permease [Hazenella sp. IB182357]|uniref:Cell division protein FtsX n=1 Tax=Polycladospora coralii TaxID=2771432 RepID=A0A926RT09_9BACL|nr:permease-like cell division protein FtsX [Polycladospora coralii]MBD1372210.1 ABC transporter permease [Polycladospora coralii]MBS7530709.1 permease-like cell division protein FtsX [Polycladospora coralii]